MEQIDDKEVREKIEQIFGLTRDYNGFGGNLFSDMKLDKVNKGHIEFSLFVVKEITNSLGFLHGGAASALVDGVGAFAYLAYQDSETPQFGVTINLNINYISSAYIGEEIVIIATVEKVTNTLIFVKSSIVRKSDKSLVSTASAIYKVPPKSKL